MLDSLFAMNYWKWWNNKKRRGDKLCQHTWENLQTVVNTITVK